METAWTQEWEKLKGEIAQMYRKNERLEKENAELRAQLEFQEKLNARNKSEN